MSIKMSEPLKGTVVLYSVIGSAKCTKARNMLAQANIPYIDVSLDDYPDCLDELTHMTGEQNRVPQIFFNDVHIGGVEELAEAMSSTPKWDALMDMLREQEMHGGPPIPKDGDENQQTHEQHYGEEILMWMPDEFNKLVADMRKANIIKDHKVSVLTTYKNSFKGEDFIEWIVRERELKRKEALEIGQELMDRNFGQQTSREVGTSFSPDRYYQLVEDDENLPLNCGHLQDHTLLGVEEYNATLVKLITPIYADIQTDNDRTIRYHKLVDNSHYNRYLRFAKELQRVDPSQGSLDERLALMVNVYNMMLVHMTHKYGPPQSVWQRRKYMNSTYYQIDEHKYSLQSIMNGILRGNKKGLGMLWRPFGKHDHRLPLVLPKCEPLVHFALTSGTRSSPPLQAYNSKTVQQEMRANARRVLSCDDAMKIDPKKNIIYLIKTFKWYSDDFGGSTEKLVSWILDVFENDDSSEKIVSLRKMFYTGEYTVDVLPYDWTFNGKETPDSRSQPTSVVDHRISSKKTDGHVAVDTPIIVA